ncbi:DUF6572 domain-containing protein [Synechococcus sp. PCC 7336]|uniref:DUF6572 domain-containing protein n=1 Tax=Synechococcus sp. PCC 7336 TaxID=195250 RepID=UPI00035EB6CD|nr:DUF6572 domain-containing protein [Synechococcus sp. PCC 7336]
MAIEDPNVIDAVIHDSETDCVSLVAIHAGEWCEKNHCIDLLKSKLDNYLEFLSSGKFSKLYSQYSHKEVRIQLELGKKPPLFISNFLDALKSELKEEYKINFIVNVHDLPG